MQSCCPTARTFNCFSWAEPNVFLPLRNQARNRLNVFGVVVRDDADCFHLHGYCCYLCLSSYLHPSNGMFNHRYLLLRGNVSRHWRFLTVAHDSPLWAWHLRVLLIQGPLLQLLDSSCNYCWAYQMSFSRGYCWGDLRSLLLHLSNWLVLSKVGLLVRGNHH